MSSYKKILIALDFQGDNAEVIEKGTSIAKVNEAEVILVHVNEPLVMAYAADGMSWSDQVVMLETSIRQEAQKKMAETGARLSLPPESCITREGRPATEIHELAKEKKCLLADLNADMQAQVKETREKTGSNKNHLTGDQHGGEDHK